MSYQVNDLPGQSSGMIYQENAGGESMMKYVVKYLYQVNDFTGKMGSPVGGRDLPGTGKQLNAWGRKHGEICGKNKANDFCGKKIPGKCTLFSECS